MAQWLRKDHVATINKEDYAYGDEIPTKKVDPEVLKKWRDKGWIGSIAKPGAISGKDALETEIANQIQQKKEVIRAKDIAEARVVELENSGATPEALKEAQDAQDTAEAKVKGLESEVESLKKDKSDLETSSKKLGDDIKKLEAENKTLKEKK